MTTLIESFDDAEDVAPEAAGITGVEFGILFIGAISLVDLSQGHDIISAFDPVQLLPEHFRSRNFLQLGPQIDQFPHSDHVSGAKKDLKFDS